MKRKLALVLASAALAASSGLAQASHPRRTVTTCDTRTVRTTSNHGWGYGWGHRPAWTHSSYGYSNGRHHGGSSLGISFSFGNSGYRSNNYSDCAPSYRHVDRYSYYTPRTVRRTETVCTTRDVHAYRPPVTIIQRPRVVERRVIETCPPPVVERRVVQQVVRPVVQPVVQVVRTEPVVTRPKRTDLVLTTPTVIERGRQVVSQYQQTRPPVILQELETERAWRALAERDIEAARVRFAGYLADHPDHPEVLAGAALVLAADGEVSRAERLMRRATQNGLTRARVRMPLADMDDVLSVLEEAYEQDTIRNDSAWFMLSALRLLRADETGAESAARQALRYDRYDSEAQLVARIAERDRGNSDI